MLFVKKKKKKIVDNKKIYVYCRFLCLELCLLVICRLCRTCLLKRILIPLCCISLLVSPLLLSLYGTVRISLPVLCNVAATVVNMLLCLLINGVSVFIY